MAKGPVTFPASTAIRETGEYRPGIDLPPPIDQRITDLVRLARGAGERTYRKEIVGALILAAPTDGVALGEMLRAYRTAAIRDAWVGPPVEVPDEITYAPRPPGPLPEEGPAKI